MPPRGPMPTGGGMPAPGSPPPGMQRPLAPGGAPPPRQGLPPGAMPPPRFAVAPRTAAPPGAPPRTSAPPARSAPPGAAPARPRPGGSVPISTPAATSDAAPPGPTADQSTLAARTADARLVRVHVRGGLLTLARTTLESMAGSGTLDRDAMADLAEVRWRSGDLEGAVDAARAHRALGGQEPIALLILAEGLANTGQADAAGTMAREVTDRVGGAVDTLFALEARSSVWPQADPGAMLVDAAAPGRWGLLVGGSEVAAPTPETWLLAALPARSSTPPVGRGGPAQPAGAGSASAAVTGGRAAGAELELAEQAFATGDATAAGDRLAVLLRLDPALAPIILSTADRAAAKIPAGDPGVAAIHLVRGDAYRLLGRDNEAAAAYQAAHQALSVGPPTKESQ